MIGHVAVMGIVNVTPDSFFDGGNAFSPQEAVEQAARMAEAGADWIDFGAESTRPGSDPVGEAEEWDRLAPVLESLPAELRYSVDTRRATIARRAIALGAAMINDVSGGDDPEMATVVAESGVKWCLMHHQGTPATMQVAPQYRDVVREVRDWLSDRIARAVASNVKPEQLLIDPGFGFGKTTEHNLRLLFELDALRELGPPILVGLSRKSFLGRITGGEATPTPVEDRLAASIAAQIIAVQKGAEVVRTHDVAETVQSLQILFAEPRG